MTEDERTRRALALLDAVELIDRWQSNITITHILDECHARADDRYFTTPTVAEFLIELAGILEWAVIPLR